MSAAWSEGQSRREIPARQPPHTSLVPIRSHNSLVTIRSRDQVVPDLLAPAECVR
jgi:hypothetical protein